MNFKNLIRLRSLIMIFTIGSIYFLIEGFWRGFQNWPSLIAEVSLWMLLIGGVSGVINGRINKSDFIRSNFNAFFQSLLFCLIVTSIEFLTGNIFSFFNIKIWGYLHLKYDWLAQISGGHISFTFMFFWFLLAPFGYWLYDILSYRFFGVGNTYKLSEPYKQLLQFWRKPNIQGWLT